LIELTQNLGAFGVMSRAAQHPLAGSACRLVSLALVLDADPPWLASVGMGALPTIGMHRAITAQICRATVVAKRSTSPGQRYRTQSDVPRTFAAINPLRTSQDMTGSGPGPRLLKIQAARFGCGQKAVGSLLRFDQF
jgi:hypothetical protein